MRLDHPAPLPAASLLQLIWLASPALPVGGFSYSEGLESAIENAGIASEAAVAEWLLDQRRIAGLGNIYVCEALFRAGLHPQAEAGTIATPTGRPRGPASRSATACRA